MKVFVVKNSVAKLGYQVRVIAEDGSESLLDMLGVDAKNDKILHLPDNPSNRKWFSVNKMSDCDEYELTYKASRTLGPRVEGSVATPKKDWAEYLEGEDKEMYLALIAKAKANREAQMSKTKVESKREALLRKLAEYEAELAKINGEN
jgi:hypothetical protein